MAVLESARGELDSAEIMLQQAETHLANLALDPNAALASPVPHLYIQAACSRRNLHFDVGSWFPVLAHIFRVVMSANSTQAEDSKLTAQIASLQHLDSGTPAASDGGENPAAFCMFVIWAVHGFQYET